MTANLERSNDASFGYLGTGMTESSGIFTFPSTGIYLVTFNASFYRVNAGDRATQVIIQVSTDGGSNYDQVGNTYGGITGEAPSAANFGHVQTQAFVDVTSTANVKVKFSFAVFGNSATTLDGNTAGNETYMNFIRLGDT